MTNATSLTAVTPAHAAAAVDVVGATPAESETLSNGFTYVVEATRFTDFNGDGKPDLVWRNGATGQNVVWSLDGVTFLGQILLPSVADTNWQILRDKR